MLHFLLLSYTFSLLAQSPEPRIFGHVTDPQGHAVAEASVRLLRRSATEALQTQTDTNGAYLFERITPGDFVLEVEKAEFRRVTKVVHIANGVLQENVTLTVAGVNQTVIVTAAGAAQVDQEISKAVSVIDKQEALDRNAISLADVIRYSPGVQIRNGGGIGQNTAFRIRGLRPDATAVLIDGLRFRDASTTQSDASSFISSLNFVNAERVEVLRGSASSLYGTNAVAGAVNVVTPQGGGPLHGELQLEGGTLGLFRGRGSVSGGLLADRLKFSAGLLHLNVSNGIDGDDAARSTGLQAFTRYDLTRSLSVSGRFLGSGDFVSLNISPATTGIPAANIPAIGVVPAIPLAPAGVAILNAGGRPDYGSATFVPGRNDPDNRRSSRFATGAFILRQTVTPLLSWQASYQRNHTWRVFQNGPAGTGSQPAAENFSRYVGDIDTADIRVMAQPSRWLNLAGGYEFERENYKDLQDNNLPAPRHVLERTRVNQDGHSVYFSSQAAFLARRLQIAFSGREQSFRLSKPEFQFTGFASNYDRVTLPSPPRALTGDASAAYLLTRASTKLRLHFGNAYRAPALYERFGAGFSNNPTTGDIVFTPYGDPRLAPDRYNSFDAGFDSYLFSNRLKISPTYFYSRVQHITAFDSSGVVNPTTDPYGRSLGYINGSGGISRGAELAVEARPLRTLTVHGSYTYVCENTDRDISVQGFYKIFTVHPHTVSIVAIQRWNKRLDTTLDLFRGSSYFNSFFAVTRSRAFEFPGYTRAGVMANYKVWQSEKRAVRAYVKVDNLFHQTYYEAGWLAARTTVLGGVGYTF